MSSFSITSINGKRCTAVPRSTTSAVVSVAATPLSKSVSPATSAAVQPPLRSSPAPAPVVPTSAAPSTESTTESTTANAASPSVAAPSAEPVGIPPSTTPVTETSEAPIEPSSPPLPDTSAVVFTVPEPTSAPTEVTPETTAAPADVPPTSTPAPAPVPISSTATPAPIQQTSSVVVSTTPTNSAPFEIPSKSAAAIAQSEINSRRVSPVSASRIPTSTTSSETSSSLLASAASATEGTATTAIAPEHTTTGSHGANAGQIAGGVLGGVAIIGLIAFFLWWLKKRRRGKRDSLLTPLTSPYTDDPNPYSDDIGRISNRRRVKEKLDIIGASIGSKVSGFQGDMKRKLSRDGSQGINLNRGNSQFIEQGSVHSRTNSSSSVAQLTGKARVADLWQKVRQTVVTRFKPGGYQGQGSRDPFDTAPSMREKQSGRLSSEYTRMVDQQRRPSLMGSPQKGNYLGSLGFTLTGSTPPTNNNGFSDPFSDKHSDRGVSVFPLANPNTMTTSSITQPKATLHVRNTSSTAAATYLPTIVEVSSNSSRHNSTDSDDYNRYTFLSESDRSRRGRSDPFDLDFPKTIPTIVPPMPSLDRAIGYEPPPSPIPPTGPTSNLLDSLDSFREMRNNAQKNRDGLTDSFALPKQDPNFAPLTQHVSGSSTYDSRYSVNSDISDWSGPGPDMGSRSNRGRAPGVSGDSWPDEMSPLTERSGYSQGSQSFGKAM